MRRFLVLRRCRGAKGCTEPRKVIAERAREAVMANLDLHYVDELIGVRQQQHGYGVGAPPVVNGHRIGVSLNRSCIVMLSALMQAYVEAVFQDAARRRFPDLNGNNADFDAYWRQVKSWGNPSDGNIRGLFIRIGVPDVFAGLSWQRQTTAGVRQKLNEVNQIRNDIAHGAAQLRLNNQPYSLSLAKVVSFRNFAEQFGSRFEAHVANLVP